jgi:hypothetical protein
VYLDPSKRVRLDNIARLALHPATSEAEWQAASVAYFRTLRSVGMTPEHLINGRDRPREDHLPDVPPSARQRACSFAFGKYQGVPIDLVDTGYLEWALKNVKRLSPRFRSLLEKELAKRPN